MTALTKYLVLVTVFFSLYSFSQEEHLEFDVPLNSPNGILEKLPKISKDSTNAEITAHVQAMIKLMTEGYYKSNYAPTLIYAEKGLALAAKSNDKNHIHKARTLIGNTLIRVKDTVVAKKLFLKSLAEANRTNDSSLLLRSKTNLANIYYYSDNEEYRGKTVRLYLESVEIASRLKDTTRWFVLYHNLSRSFNAAKNCLLYTSPSPRD